MRPLKRKRDGDSESYPPAKRGVLGNLKAALSDTPAEGQRLKLVNLNVLRTHAQALERDIGPVLELAERAGSDVVVAKTTLEALKSHVQKLKASLEAVRKAIRLRKRQVKTPAKAVQTVFNLPDVAEEILLYLHPLDVLRVRATCKSLKSMIETSTKIQKHLFLAPNEAQHYRYLELSRWGPCSSFIQTAIGSSILRPDPAAIHFSALVKYGLHEVGSRVSNMQLSQPAICSLEYSADCCGQRRFNRVHLSSSSTMGETRVVTNTEGLTLGDLFEAAQNMMADHNLCLHAAEHAHGKDGIVRPDIHFSCKLELAKDDPIIQQVEREVQVEDKKKRKFQKMTAYRNAKQAAHSQGLPIPTPAEFEASLAT